MAEKRAFKHARAATPEATRAFIDAAPYASAAAETVGKVEKGGDAQLHVLMPKDDLKALKMAALQREKSVSDLVREAVQMYIGTK